MSFKFSFFLHICVIYNNGYFIQYSKYVFIYPQIKKYASTLIMIIFYVHKNMTDYLSRVKVSQCVAPANFIEQFRYFTLCLYCS